MYLIDKESLPSIDRDKQARITSTGSLQIHIQPLWIDTTQKIRKAINPQNNEKKPTKTLQEQ